MSQTTMLVCYYAEHIGHWNSRKYHVTKKKEKKNNEDLRVTDPIT
jgi:hypothetical protein